MKTMYDNDHTGKTPAGAPPVGAMVKQLPNLITLLNLFCGCCAVLNVFYGQVMAVFWFFAAAIAADYFDGMAARRLGVHSPLGKELDSLADMVSFGFLPGAIFYALLLEGLTGQLHADRLYWAATPGFLITLFSALRLGKFNLDTRQAEYFVGLPTPSSSLFSVGLLLMFHFNSLGLADWVSSPALLYPLAVVLSGLLVAELPMFNLKFKSMAWTGNEIKVIFAAAAILMLVTLREAALSLIVILYVVLSLILKLLNRPA